MVERIASAIGTELSQQRDLHQTLPVGFDQVLDSGVGEQAVDMLVRRAAVRPGHFQVSPVAEYVESG